MHCHGKHVFFHCDGIIEFSLPIQKLSKPSHHVVSDFLLRLQLGFKHYIFVISIADDGHRPLAKRGDVNAEAVP